MTTGKFKKPSVLEKENWHIVTAYANGEIAEDALAIATTPEGQTGVLCLISPISQINERDELIAENIRNVPDMLRVLRAWQGTYEKYGVGGGGKELYDKCLELTKPFLDGTTKLESTKERQVSPNDSGNTDNSKQA